MIDEKKYRIVPFVRLGELLHAELSSGSLDPVIDAASRQNPWFVRASVTGAIEAIVSEMLDPQKLDRWLRAYRHLPFPRPRAVGVIMAGNIPLAGFFDLLCVCICGHRCAVKTSSKDSVLMDYVIGRLLEAGPELQIDRLENCAPDAVIATGSDNTNRYFRALYGSIPALLRGSRSSVAIVDGQESDADLAGLARDIFQYGGLGCRNVSLLFVPAGYDLQKLREHLSSYPMDIEGYRNNYLQTRALARMNGEEFIDGGFYLLQQGEGFGPALSRIEYRYYNDPAEVESWLRLQDTQIQCVVSGPADHPRGVRFGESQRPALSDYPDGVDVLRFLHQLN